MSNVLIVAQDEKTCEQVRHAVNWSNYGYSAVFAAHSYYEAIHAALELKPNVALIDIALGDHDGWELAQYLHLGNTRVAICMIADACDTQSILASMRAGAQDFLTKPVAHDALSAFLERQAAWYPQEQEKKCLATRKRVDPVLAVEYASFSKITNEIISAVQAGYHLPQSLTSIADGLNMSSKYIGRVFLRDTGMKFTQYLTAYRMHQARRLIVETKEKISVIATMVGYPQQNNFYIHFKDYFGVSPSTLRAGDGESPCRNPSKENHYEKPI